MAFVDRNLSQNQMHLFVHADDIKAGINNLDIESGDVAGHRSPEMMWETKEKEARLPASAGKLRGKHGAGVYDSVKAEGIHDPIEFLMHGGKKSPTETWLVNGHHRVAAASALAREGGNGFVPVSYKEHR